MHISKDIANVQLIAPYKSVECSIWYLVHCTYRGPSLVRPILIRLSYPPVNKMILFDEIYVMFTTKKIGMLS